MKQFRVEAYGAYRTINRYGCDIDENFVEGLNNSIATIYNQPDVVLTIEEVRDIWVGNPTNLDGLYLTVKKMSGVDSQLLTEYVRECIEDTVRDSFIEEDYWASGDEEYFEFEDTGLIEEVASDEEDADQMRQKVG